MDQKVNLAQALCRFIVEIITVPKVGTATCVEIEHDEDGNVTFMRCEFNGEEPNARP